MMHMRFSVLVCLASALPGFFTAPACRAQETSLVHNGDFEQGVDESGAPRQWQTSGRGEIKQVLSLDNGHNGGKAARLECAVFVGGTPDAHVMLCQLGTVSIRRGQWYRLRFWVKGAGVGKPMGSVAVSNTRPWGSSGVDGQFVTGVNWRQVEILCQGTDDVPAATSRLQFWFTGTGTMWFDDIVLEPVEMVEKFHPAVSVAGVKNVIPNGSFECGGAGWGSYSPTISTWAGNLNQLWGTIDPSTAQHGQRSLRIDLNQATAPVFHWDYYDAIVEPVRTILCANVGWVPVSPGKPCVLSCYLKSSHSAVPALMMVTQSNGARHRQRLEVGTEWRQFQMAVTPAAEYLWIAVGIDLSPPSIEAASLWVDCVQLEFGDEATSFEPRAVVESTIETPVNGNIFTDPEAGISVDVQLYNSADQPANVRGRIVVTDFVDREVLSQPIARSVPATLERSSAAHRTAAWGTRVLSNQVETGGS